MKILVGMSGGVDSTAAVLILNDQGYEVEGVIMQIWENNPYFVINKRTRGSCYSPNGENIDEAKKVANSIGVKLNVIDCRAEYKKTVLKNFRNEYLQGRTPNPCVWCNSLIKFGALVHFAHQAGIEFDKFATGHYAKIEELNGRFLLRRGKDLKKDQTYFLYRLTQKQLSGTMLPLGSHTKEEIRAYARSHGLITAQKPDSQDFYNGSLNDLFRIKDSPGNIVDLDGKILGIHNGIWNYTVGQRRGIKISAPKPLYVAELRKDTNEVVVGFLQDVKRDFLYAENLNWIKYAPEDMPAEFIAFAKIRSAQSPKSAVVRLIKKNRIKVEFEEPISSVARGQSVVLYENDYVLGGGIIE